MQKEETRKTTRREKQKTREMMPSLLEKISSGESGEL